MDWTSHAPLAAAGLFVVLAVASMRRSEAVPRWLWLVPAALCVAFLGYTLVAAGVEGPFGFWPEHTRNLWGNQIWFDLLLGIGIGWFLIVPQARRVGMRLPPWLLLVALGGSIGFTAMLARLLYLQARAPHAGRR